MSPYSDFVPVDYIQSGMPYLIGKPGSKIKGLITLRRRENKKDFSTEMIDRIYKKHFTKESPVKNIFVNDILNDNLTRSHMLRGIEGYLNYDSPLSVDMPSEWSYSRIYNSGKFFTGVYTSDVIKSRSYRLRVGYYMAAIERERHPVPIIVLVVPREKLKALKIKWLLTGEIDLSMCLLLVDKELHTPRFLEKGFRNNCYKKYIKPIIDDLKVDMWEVPSSFIQERCFLPDYKLQAHTLRGMKQEKEDIIKKFCVSLREKFNPTRKEEEIVHEPDQLDGLSITRDVGITGHSGLTTDEAGNIGLESFTVTVGNSITAQGIPWTGGQVIASGGNGGGDVATGTGEEGITFSRWAENIGYNLGIDPHRQGL